MGWTTRLMSGRSLNTSPLRHYTLEETMKNNVLTLSQGPLSQYESCHHCDVHAWLHGQHGLDQSSQWPITTPLEVKCVMTAHTSEEPHCHCSLPKRSEKKKVDPPIGHDWPQAPTINTACQAFNQLSKNFLRNQASSSSSTASTRAGCGSSAASQRS